MLAFRNLSLCACAAVVSMVAFSMTGCCCGKKAAAPLASPAISQPCTTCGDAGGFSTAVPTAAGSGSVNVPSQSFSTPTAAGSGTVNVPSQSFSTPTAAGSGSVNVPSQSFSTPSFNSGSVGGSGSVNVPSFGGGSGSR